MSNSVLDRRISFPFRPAVPQQGGLHGLNDIYSIGTFKLSPQRLILEPIWQAVKWFSDRYWGSWLRDLNAPPGMNPSDHGAGPWHPVRFTTGAQYFYYVSRHTIGGLGNGQNLVIGGSLLLGIELESALQTGCGLVGLCGVLTTEQGICDVWVYTAPQHRHSTADVLAVLTDVLFHWGATTIRLTPSNNPAEPLTSLLPAITAGFRWMSEGHTRILARTQP